MLVICNVVLLHNIVKKNALPMNKLFVITRNKMIIKYQVNTWLYSLYFEGKGNIDR